MLNYEILRNIAIIQWKIIGFFHESFQNTSWTNGVTRKIQNAVQYKYGGWL